MQNNRTENRTIKLDETATKTACKICNDIKQFVISM